MASSFAQSARAGDIKSVAASVNDRADVHTLTNVIQIPTAEDRDRRLHDQRLQRLPHGIREQRFLRLTDDRRKGAVIVEKNGELPVAASDLLNVLQRRRNHTNSRFENRNSINYKL